VIRLTVLPPPESVNVYDRERAITLGRDDDALRRASIVYQVMGIKELLPAAPPSIAVVATPGQDPLSWVVSRGIGGPGPNHILVKHGQQEIHILRIPGAGFAINDLADL
jgi:hypothetical protein